MIDTKAKFYELVRDLFELAKDKETAPSWALTLKLGEELGEFQEAALKEYGFLKHKDEKEGVWGEAADMINVLIGFFAQHFPDMSPEELTEKLYEATAKKGEKYRQILEQEERRRREELNIYLAQGIVDGDRIE